MISQWVRDLIRPIIWQGQLQHWKYISQNNHQKCLRNCRRLLSRINRTYINRIVNSYIVGHCIVIVIMIIEIWYDLLYIMISYNNVSFVKSSFFLFSSPHLRPSIGYLNISDYFLILLPPIGIGDNYGKQFFFKNNEYRQTHATIFLGWGRKLTNSTKNE